MSVLIAGALIVAAGVVLGNLAVALTGAAAIVLCLVTVAILQRRGTSAPISFAWEFPADTAGSRATSNGDSAPPIDTAPSDTASGRPRT